MADHFHKHLDGAELRGERLAAARALLVKPRQAQAAWPALAAAGLFAASALTFAIVVILAPTPAALL